MSKLECGPVELGESRLSTAALDKEIVQVLTEVVPASLHSKKNHSIT